MQPGKLRRVDHFQVVFGNDGRVKANTLCFPKAGFQVRNVADLTAQADLADGQRLFRHGQIQQAGCHGQTNRKITGCLIQAEPADDVDVDILIGENVSGPLFQHRQQQIHPVVVKPAGRAPGTGEGGFGHKRLNLTQNRTGPLHHTGNAGAGNSDGTAFQHDLGRILNLFQPLAGHIKHPDFVGGAVAVFHGAQDPVRKGLVPLKIEHGIHDVFHDLWPGNRAVLVHMTHNKGWNLVGFGHAQKAGRALLDLAHSAGGGRHIGTAHGLDGVDHHKVGFHLLNQTADLIHIALGDQGNVVLRDPEPLSTELDLAHRFLSGDIQHIAGPGNLAAEL